MNEKGFFTLIGLCFLLVAALLVKGVQESEKNYSNITTDFHTEVDLQNIADSALIEAVDLIKSNEITLKNPVLYAYSRKINQYPIPLNRTYDADVKVFYEYGVYSEVDFINGEIVTVESGNIYRMRRDYKSGDSFKDTDIDDKPKKGVILISVASREIEGSTVYRRAMGYFLTGEDADGKIYFMNSLDKEK